MVIPMANNWFKGIIHIVLVRFYEVRGFQFGEAETGTSKEAKQCTTVDKVSNKTYFSHVKRVRIENN